MWGVIPAAGIGSRIQPLAFSKELLPVGSRLTPSGERPCAVSEYLLERMIIAGVTKICFVIAPGKTDIMEYFGAGYGGAEIAYVIQPEAGGLCDSIFRAHTVIQADEPVVIGLPDTIWFPDDALTAVPENELSFLLFPVDRPELFDAVLMSPDGAVREIQVKRPDADSSWIWGAFKMPGHVFAALHRLWLARGASDEFIGTLVNAYLAEGGTAIGVKAGEAYVDVGTLNGYRAAITLLAEMAENGRGRLSYGRNGRSAGGIALNGGQG